MMDPADEKGLLFDNKVCVAVLNITLLSTWGFLGFDSSLLAHSSEDNDICILFINSEELLNLLSNFSVRNLNIILCLSVISHQREETIIRNIEQLIFLASDIWDVHVMGRWAKLLKLLASEDIDSNKMDLCVAVLASFGGGHVDDLARSVLDNNETVLSQGRTLHGKRGRGTCIGRVESVLMLGIIRHFD